jgi:hypothetical protein
MVDDSHYIDDTYISPWTTVKDKLPDEGVSVIAYGKDIGIGTGYIWKCGEELFWSMDSEDLWNIDKDVITHWMPLPDAPII